MTKIKINGSEYPIISAVGLKYNEREAIKITLESTWSDATTEFIDDAPWSIIDSEDNEYDYSDYCVSCEIADYRDGTFGCVMGRPTELEQVLEAIYG